MTPKKTSQKKQVKSQSDTNRDRRARRNEKQASPKTKPTPSPEPVALPLMPPQEAALLPAFARDLVPVAPEPVVVGPDPEADFTLPPTDQAVEQLMEELGNPTPFTDRSGLPADHPAHRLSVAQWVRLQVTMEAMGRGENAWRAMNEVADASDLLDRITWHILACEAGPDLQRQIFEAPE